MSETVETKIVDANTQEITYQTEKRIITLADLIEVAKIDLNEWEIEKSAINKWEGFTNPESGPEPFPLFQVKAFLKRKNLVAIFPVVQPIEIKLDPLPFVEIPKRIVNKALILADMHIGFRRNLDTNSLTPFQDRKAISTAINIARDIQPNIVVLNGDILDMNCFSDKFLREPEFFFTTQHALIEANFVLSQLRMACPSSRIILLSGNHEDRLRKSMAVHYLEAYSLKTIGEDQEMPVLGLYTLLNAKKLGIEVIDSVSEGFWLNENLLIKHGDTAKAINGATVKGLLSEMRSSVIVSHIHRSEDTYKTVRGKDTIKVYSAHATGALCKLDGTVPGSEKSCNWNNGIIEVDYENGNGAFNVKQIIIDDGCAMYDGKIYKGTNYLNDLRKQTKKNF